MFHQLEGIYIDQDVNFANLKDLIFKITYHLFGNNIQVRFRASYFPFTEPSAEVDILSKDGKWLEILGCGIVNPIVLENCKIDSQKYLPVNGDGIPINSFKTFNLKSTFVLLKFINDIA